MAKKYKVVTINGVKLAVAILKDTNRPLVPSPVRSHTGKKDYYRPYEKIQVRKEINDVY